ncbi:hypothetical protein [Vibrio cholerae]|uniref:hypothetical protein n=1 Tax=Vibrio cholerae TaxID=666 RepID=UPI002DB9409A|nr:hypothetical protein [Vibrio cholerae]
MQQNIQNIALGLKCPKCNFPLGGLNKQIFLNYFNSNKTACSHCHELYDVFEVIEGCIDENFFYNDVYSFVGAEKAIFNIILDVKPPTALKFVDYGIPVGSRILHVNYTPQGQGLFPLEFHGNSPYRGAPKDQVILYPAKFASDEASPTKLSVMVTWINAQSLENVSLKSLVDAFEEYSNNELVTSIVPANTAIEFDVMRYAKDELQSVSSKTSVNDFFKSGISYIPILKVLIPLVAKMKNFPMMPEKLIASLVELASLRNQIAHTGTTKAPLNKSQVVKCLTAVILGKMYIEELRNA